MLKTDGELTAIVFGGAGFIGSHLLEWLQQTGRYTKLISFDLKQPTVRIPGIDYVIGDVRQPISMSFDSKNAEIYNLAAVHTTPGHEDWEYFWTNVLGATHICDFARRIDCRFIIFTSSISVYGPKEDAIDGEAPPLPNSAYGRSKLRAEGIHRSWLANREDQRLVIVRPAVIFGQGEGGNFTRLADLLSRKRFVYPGRRDTIKSCGYVRELVQTMEFARALDRKLFIYNFAYPARSTTEDICAAFAEVGGFPMPKRVMPLPIMLAAGLAFEMLGKVGLRTSINRARVYKLVHSTNIYPTALTQEGYVFKSDLKNALLDWKERSSGRFV